MAACIWLDVLAKTVATGPLKLTLQDTVTRMNGLSAPSNLSSTLALTPE